MNWINQLVALDQEVLIFLNNLSTPWADKPMLLITATWPWIPFYAILLYLIVKEFKYDTLWIVLCIVLTITLCDQIASSIFKPWIMRLRPCHEPSVLISLRMVTDCGGEYGFFSSHASNSFGLAMFSWLLFKQKSRYWNWAFVWALVVSYSRIYLGKHYPLDIIAGAICGVLVAYAMFQLYLLLRKKFPLPIKSNLID